MEWPVLSPVPQALKTPNFQRRVSQNQYPSGRSNLVEIRIGSYGECHVWQKGVNFHGRLDVGSIFLDLKSQETIYIDPRSLLTQLLYTKGVRTVLARPI